MSPELFDVSESPLTGRNLVEASAGTGKTFAIAALVVRLVLEARLRIDQILVVTFTEAATEELRGRVRGRLRDALRAYVDGASDDPFLARLLEKVPPGDEALEDLTEALRAFDQAPIHTIHGFCQRVLQEKAFECGSPFDAELMTDEGPLLREAVEDFWRRELYGATPAFAGFVRDHGVTPESLASFASRKARAPALMVLPKVEKGGQGPEGEVRAAYEAVREHWREGRPEVGEILATHPALNRAIYRPTSVSSWLAAMDQYLNGGEPWARPECLAKFCTPALAKATKKGHQTPFHPLFGACENLRVFLAALEAEFALALVGLKARLVEHVRAELPRRKAEENVRSFDDLLRSVRAALEGEGGPSLASALRERYRAALVDEFQDTDPVQYAIFGAIYRDEDSRLFLIGDPKQAIYGFRGADVFAYMEAARRSDHRFTLGANWRSAPRLVEAVNAVFGRVGRAFVFEQIPFQPVAPASRQDRKPLVVDGREDPSPLRIWFVQRDGGKPPSKGAASRLILAAVAGEVVRLLRAGAAGEARIGDRPLGPGDIAVLVRTNRQAREVQTVLRSAGVASVLHGSESLFGSREAEEWLRVLAAVADPGRERRVRAALATDLLGVSAEQLDLEAADDATWDRWLQRFARYLDLWRGRGFAVMARALLAEEGVRARLLPYPDGERRLTNVLHCVEVLEQATLEGKLGPEGLVDWLGRRIAEPSGEEEHQIRLETDDEALKIATVHKAKGLEYPIVFCPFGWAASREKEAEVLFHDPDHALRVILDLGSDRQEEHRRLAEREALAENLRLLYVALTRAKERCYVVWGGLRDAETSALAYLLHSRGEDVGSEGADGPPEAAVDRLASVAGALSDEAMLADLAALADSAKGALAVSPLPLPSSEPYRPPHSPGPELACRAFVGPVPSRWGLASFSSLISGRDEAADLPDRDEWAVGARSGLGEREGASTVPTIADFPAGTAAGTCFHDILEEADFAASPETLQRLVEDKLDLHGMGRDWTPVVSETLGRLFRAPIDREDPTFCLSRIGRQARVSELEFYLPAGLLTPEGLGEVFAAHGGPDVSRSFVETVRNLRFRPTAGFVKGYIDLLFRTGDRYYIVDWKSNRLGDSPAAYGPMALRTAMVDHLYDLQVHLYAAAVHRHLAARLPGYEYDRHFGAVLYVFLRGVDLAAVPGHAVHRSKPRRVLVEALAAYLVGGG